MGDTDFFGRVGELESLQDAYDSRIAEMAIVFVTLSTEESVERSYSTFLSS